MAVGGIPFWLSTAKGEYGGNNSVVSTLASARMPAPRWVSSFAGTSNVITKTAPGGTRGTINLVAELGLQAGQPYTIIIPGNAVYVANSTGEPAVYCEIAAPITLIVQAGALIFGRGGNGGNGGAGGKHNGAGGGGAGGGPAMRLSRGHVNLVNQGADIRGGGGGGGGGGASSRVVGGGCGGGGRPYGAHGGGAYLADPTHPRTDVPNADFNSWGRGARGGSPAGGSSSWGGTGGNGGDLGAGGGSGQTVANSNAGEGNGGGGGGAGEAVQWT